MLSASANVARLRQLVSFERVVAPFAGTVTARNTDVGALISAGGGAGSELFHVADTRRLRVYVQVPQADAATIVPGLAAELHVADHPGQRFPAKLVRTAKAIDPGQRTLLAELAVDNRTGALLAGSYAEVHLKLPMRKQHLRLPANALIFRDAGLQVATVSADRRVKLKSIKLGRDFGTSVEVIDGLAANDQVIANPPDSISDGQVVRVVAGGGGSAR
jgi:Membrane-fusion protein